MNVLERITGGQIRDIIKASTNKRGLWPTAEQRMQSSPVGWEAREKPNRCTFVGLGEGLPPRSHEFIWYTL